MIDSNLKIASLNVRDLADRKKRLDTFEWLKSKQCAIYCLQDIHINSVSEGLFRNDWGGECIVNSYSSVSRGVAILFSRSLDFTVKKMHTDTEGNLLVVNTVISDTFEIIIAVLYGPNRDEPDFYSNLKSRLSEIEDVPLVICGDWNLVQNYQIDTLGYLHENNKKSKCKVEEMKAVLELSDSWRLNNEKAKKYTWFCTKISKKMARLDFYLVSPDLLPKIVKTDMAHGYPTDHSIIYLTVDTKVCQRGKGFWKFNVSLLYDPVYVKLVKEEIHNVKTQYHTKNNEVDSQTFFEMLKLNIRGKTISYSSYKCKCEKKKNNKVLRIK